MPAPGFRPDPSILAALVRHVDPHSPSRVTGRGCPTIPGCRGCPDCQGIGRLHAAPIIPATQTFEVEDITFAPVTPVEIPEHIARSLRGAFVRPATPAELDRAERQYAELNRWIDIPAQPVARLDLSSYCAGDLLRTINAHPGKVTIEGTGSEADGEWDLVTVENSPAYGGITVTLVPRGSR